MDDEDDFFASIANTPPEDRIGLLDEADWAFVEAYINKGNATQAMLAIHPEMPPNTASQKGSALLKRPEVKGAIRRRREDISEALGISNERIVREYARLAFFDPARLFDIDGRPLPLTEIDQDTRRAIVGLDIEALFAGAGDNREQIGNVRKYKLADRKAALDSLARIRGMFNDKLAIDATDKLGDRLDAAIAALKGAKPE